MKAYKCDDCREFFEDKGFRGAYYLVRGVIGSFYELNGRLDLCDKCWNKMLKKVFKDLETKE